MKYLNTIKTFFTTWPRKKIMITSIVGLAALAVGLTTWAVWPNMNYEDKPKAKKIEEKVAYKDLQISAFSTEKNIAIGFSNEDGAVTGQKFSVKLVKVEEVDVSKATNSSQTDQTQTGKTQSDTIDQSDNQNSTETTLTKKQYDAAISEYTKQLDSVEGITLVDEDQDGLIYQENLDAGNYEIWYVPIEGYFPTQKTIPAVVNDKPVYTIDTNIQKKVTKYVASQDAKPAAAAPVEVKVTDTVKLLESTEKTVTKTVTKTAKAQDPYANCPKNPDGTIDKTQVDTTQQLTAETTSIKLYKDEACTQVATVADYDATKNYYYQEEVTEKVYTGWQTLDGVTYYYDENNQAVTGNQIIGGVMYYFNSDGSLSKAKGAGIDVSRWNGNINWSQVKAAGINYVYVRCGGRYSSARTLYQDPTFYTNVKGARAAGLQVGVYLYSTASNVAEAAEEASLAVSMAKQAGGVNLPIYIDVEDKVCPTDKALMTAICKTFCETVNAGGYQSGVYASISWWTGSRLNYSGLSRYHVWIARYNSTLSGGKYTWNGRCDVWQYSKSGRVNGMSGDVDLDMAY